MSTIEDLDIKYDVKRQIMVVAIVAIVLLLIFVFWPLIYDLLMGGTVESRDPSKRIHDNLPIFSILINF